MSGPLTIPGHRVYGLNLPSSVRAALKTATPTHDGYRIHPELHPVLRPHSLVDARQPYLSAFGTKVLKELQKGPSL